jgi:hypothetical protein
VLTVPLSNTSLFVSTAIVTALGLRTLLRAEWRRLPGALSLAVTVAAVDLAALAWLVPARDNPTLVRYWAAIGTFLPLDEGPSAAAAVAGHRLAAVLSDVGFGPWPVAVVLAAVGVAVFWRAGFPAVGITLPLLGAELAVAGATRRFPFAEGRTSLFALAVVALFAAVGVGTIAARLLARGPTLPLGAAVLLGMLGLLGPAAITAGATRIPRELIPEQVRRIQAARRPGDVVVVAAYASWQYAYYAPDQPTFVGVPPAWTSIHFTVAYPGRGDVLVVDGLDDAAIQRTLAKAAARSRRIWIVLGHSEPGRGEEARLEQAARLTGRLTKLGPGVQEEIIAGPLRRVVTLERPWLVEVGPTAGTRPSN